LPNEPKGKNQTQERQDRAQNKPCRQEDADTPGEEKQRRDNTGKTRDAGEKG
jgi:hypothetical protein